MNEKDILRKFHAKMEDDKALSYIGMAMSPIFQDKYKLYAGLLEDYILSKQQSIRILNLGFASGNVEKFILDKFGQKINFVSYDNSSTFYNYATELNKTHIKNNLSKFKLLDVIENDFEDGEFDIILSRDLNHHLNELQMYLEKCFNALKDDGIMLMEDLRFNAEPSAIRAFIEKIFEVEVFKKDRWLLYLKLHGLIESYTVSYATEEIMHLIDQTDFSYSYFKSPPRYHFVLYKNKNIAPTVNNIISNLRGINNG